MSENQLIEEVVAWVRQTAHERGMDGIDITPDTDLIGSGILDSFSFVDLLLFVETCVGCKLDFGEVDPTEFVVIQGLCRRAVANRQA